MSITIIVIAALVISAFFNNPSQTVTLVTIIIGIMGATFIAQKIQDSFKNDYSEILKWLGRCMAAVPAVALLKIALLGVPELFKGVFDLSQSVSGATSGLNSFLEQLNSFIGK